MVVFEAEDAAVRDEELLRRDVEVCFFVEFELRARDGVDEGRDDLVEGPEEPGDLGGELAGVFDMAGGEEGGERDSLLTTHARPSRSG